MFSMCSLAATSQAKRSILRSIKLRKINNFPLTISFIKGIHTEEGTCWIEPEGYETGIKIYNTLSKSKVPFRTLNEGLVTWYNCGPTVYDSSHIGHALCYVKLDIIRRILQEIFDLTVVQVTGITDIDDKIIIRAKELNQTTQIITQIYEKEFFQGMQKLNVLSSPLTPRVTDFVPQIISFIERVMEKGLAYAVDDGSVYFDADSYGRSGKFVQQTDNVKARVISDPMKKTVRDFALWKGSKDKDNAWESPWGPGRPGWHIECSAIASHIFGEKLDLHSGGLDLIFPHHENEEAQCCAYHDCNQWCNYWIHSGLLYYKGQTKMSKSLHNTISIEKFLEEHSSNTLRLLCLSIPYRTSVDYSSESIVRARSELTSIVSFFQEARAYIRGSHTAGALDDQLLLKTLAEVKIKVRTALADDFDTREAMSSLLDLISLCNKEFRKKRQDGLQAGGSTSAVAAVVGYIQRLLTHLGMKFDQQLLESDSGVEEKYLNNVLDSTLQFRQTVRNYALLKEDKEDTQSLSKEVVKLKRKERAPLIKACDRIRDELDAAGIDVKDHEGTASWSFKKETMGLVETKKKED